MKLSQKAKNLAILAHGHQMRRGGQEPYVNHPIRVAEALQKLDVPDHVVAAAYLHDIIEDTQVTYADLFHAGFDDYTTDLVQLLSKQPGESNQHYIQRLIDSQNRWAMLIKIYDINDNLVIDPEHLWEGWETASIRYVKNRVLLINACNALKGERDA